MNGVYLREHFWANEMFHRPQRFPQGSSIVSGVKQKQSCAPTSLMKTKNTYRTEEIRPLQWFLSIFHSAKYLLLYLRSIYLRFIYAMNFLSQK